MADEAAQTRIKTHMNNDHARELSHYLRHFAGVSPRAALRPWLKSLTLDGMTIAAGGLGGREFNVPFTPPLKSLSEARTRLVAMDAEARDALGLADIYVDKYTWPTTPFEVIVASTILAYSVSFATLPLVTPANPALFDLVQKYFPGGVDEYRGLVKTIIWPLVGIHIVETWYLARSRLHKHGVVTGTKLWWSWVASTMFEGFGCFTRIDRMVAEKRAEKEKKAH